MDTPLQTALRKAFDSKLSLIAQTLTPEQKAQVVKNLDGTFLPLTGGDVSGRIQFSQGSYISPNSSKWGGLDIGANGDPSSGDKGASITLRNETAEGVEGFFQLFARNSSNTCAFEGTPSGTLTWNTHKVITDVFNNSANNNDNAVFRLSNGLQIILGAKEVSPTSDRTAVTFPMPFKDAPVVIPTAMDTTNRGINPVSRSATGFTFRTWWASSDKTTVVNEYTSLRYIAIGRW